MPQELLRKIDLLNLRYILYLKQHKIMGKRHYLWTPRSSPFKEIIFFRKYLGRVVNPRNIIWAI